MSLQCTLLRKIFVMVLLFVLLASGCQTAPAGVISSSGGLRSWVDQPFDDAVLPLAPYTLKAHASNEASGITQVTFLANGITVSVVPTDASQSLVYAEGQWNPSAPGEYLIQAQAQGAGGTALSDAIRVCISSGEKDTLCALSKSGEEQLPAEQLKQDITVTPITIGPQGNQEFKLGASPDPVYIGDCKKGEPTLVNFEGYAGDTSGAIEVDLHGVLHSASGSQQEFYVAMTPAGGGGWLASYNLSSLDASTLGGSPGTLVYTMALLNDRKEFYATSPERTLQVIPCGAVAQPGITPFTITTVAPQQPPPVGSDTAPPVVKASISDNVIYFGGKNCRPNKVTVSAYVTDNVAISQVKLFWYYAPGGDPYSAQSVNMSGSGTNWSYAITPVQTGTIAYWVQAWDTSNNSAQSQGPNTVTVVDCQQQPQPVVTTPPPQQPPPPPKDSTGPVLSGGGSSSDVVYYGGSCNPTSVFAKVSASDESGVGGITVYWNYSTSSGSDSASSGSYTFPPPNKGDTLLQYYFVASDTLGNSTTGNTFTVKVTECAPP